MSPIEGLARCRAILGVAFCLLLAACGGKKTDATQLVARVGTDEISVHELNAALARLPEGGEAVNAQTSRELLEKLIDERLAADQAVNNKLDRSPAVVLAMEEARRDILAQAYLQQVVARQAKPSTVDVNRYFDEHPALFAERRIYTLRELDIQPAGSSKAMVTQMVAQNKSPDEIAAWLQASKIVFQNNSVTRPAEDLPMSVLDKISAVKDGSTVTLETPGDDFHVLQVLSSQSAPLSRTDAQSKIERFLQNQQSQDAIREELHRLRTVTKIDYLGEFASGSSPSASPTEPRAN